MIGSDCKTNSSVSHMDTLELSECDNLSSIVEIALRAGKDLRSKLEEMREAVESGNNELVLKIAHDICSVN